MTEYSENSANPKDVSQDDPGIAALFDGMADEYDDITDFWYAWLCSRLHYFLALELSKVGSKMQCLDIGCGTGFQTNLLALFGHDALGIDISDKLLEQARKKVPEKYISTDLFQSPFKFMHTYSEKLRRLATEARHGRSVGRTDYIEASATSLPGESETKDIVVCCGSTLNFVQNYNVALQEMARVLRPKGLFFLEVENRYNPDLLWALFDGVLPLHLGYDQNWRVGLKNLTLTRKMHVMIDYPFETHSETVNMPLRLFSRSLFVTELKRVGLEVTRIHGIHNITNLLPSTALGSPSPSKALLGIAGLLRKIEELAGSWPLIRAFGCSTVYIGQKT